MDRRELIEEDPDFYRRSYHRLINFTYFVLFLNLLMLCFIAYQYFTLPTPSYFITTVDGRLMEIAPSAKP